MTIVSKKHQQELESVVAQAVALGLHENEANVISLNVLRDFIYLREQGFTVFEITYGESSPFLHQKMKEALLRRHLQEKRKQ